MARVPFSPGIRHLRDDVLGRHEAGLPDGVIAADLDVRTAHEFGVARSLHVFEQRLGPSRQNDGKFGFEPDPPLIGDIRVVLGGTP